ncbi:MAG TPA: symmetrical bis(5'-nucleosyl)-tetraphosphatase [Steroidobacteraceae bacterium]|nr:symmetrical bis(5'-nucleosyl)-tetraphosphatase [Steroidobacteraceae bacterium]
MATYAIGDIQGCCDEFETLLAQLRFDPARDRLWLTGDLVNRGPRSLDVLRLVKRLGSAAITVLGNHDLHLLAVALAPNERVKPQDTLGPILHAPDRDELLKWLRSQPLLHHDAALGYTMIHAGLPPQWDLETAQSCAHELEQALRDDARCLELFTHMYGDRPNRWSDDLRGVDRLRFITNCLTRLRFCRSDGTLELKFKGEIDSAPQGVMPWFRVPRRRSRELHIVCGHWSALGYHDGDGVLSIDTGCVWGEKLCAIRLDQRAGPVFVRCSSSGLTVEKD